MTNVELYEDKKLRNERKTPRKRDKSQNIKDSTQSKSRSR